MVKQSNRILQFNPTISMGNIVTIIAIVGGFFASWVTMHSDINALKAENETRKTEITTISVQRQADQDKQASALKGSQDSMERQIEVLSSDIKTGFNRIEDKLDRKEDKRVH